tara:strand:+ start:206 stop:499 length:294 start_codon:yes stop_codon:yes gene_type:complete
MIIKKNDKKISETLNVIKKALENDPSNLDEKEPLILDNLVQEDGTIKKIIDDNETSNTENIDNVLNDKISKILDENLELWLNKNMPNLIKKHLKKDN